MLGNFIRSLTGSNASFAPDLSVAHFHKIPSALTRFKQSLGMVQAGQGGIDVVCWGDSIMESFVGTAVKSFDSTIHRLKVKLQENYNPSGVVGGYGYIPMFRGYGTNDLITGFGTRNGGWAPNQSIKRMGWKVEAGANGGYVRLNGTDPAFNRTATSAIQFLAFKGPSYGTARWDVGEGAAPAIGAGVQSGTHNQANATVRGGVRMGATEGFTNRLTLDPSKDNYVQWTGAETGGLVAYDGFIAYNGDWNSGIRVHDLAYYGQTVGGMLNNQIDYQHGSSRWGSGNLAGGASNAKLYIFDWITNDCGRNVAPETSVAVFKQRYEQVVDYALSQPSQPSVILYIPPMGADPDLKTRPVGERYSDFVAAIYEISNARQHVGIVDLYEYFDREPQSNTAGKFYEAGWYSDGIHYSLKGYSEAADILFEAITS